MKLSRFVLTAAAIMSPVLFAQTQSDAPPPPPPPTQAQPPQPDPQKLLNHLTRKLALTSDQQNQILPILTSREQQVAAIQSDSSLDQKQRHAKLAAVRADAQSRLRNVLTDAQRTTYDEMQQQARDRARAKKQGGVS